MDRRTFLRAAGAGAGSVAVASVAARVPAADATPAYFRHGVASGDPLPSAVLLWTRVTPTAEALPGSGRGPDVDVRWQVARDASFRTGLRTGTVRTGRSKDHTVKVPVDGLAPSTTYWYRFLYAGDPSRVGRTRTAPPTTSNPSRLRLGIVSCANWEGGFFSAYRHLADCPNLDAVLHLGDYVYEYGPGEYGPGPSIGRTHDPTRETVTLADYRRRHAQYKTDPDLARLHAQVPFIVTWDDHETANDRWQNGAENHQPATEGSFAVRAAAARQAYFEWMPIRATSPGQIYRRLRFGRLADLSMLDLRSYRSQQVTQQTIGRADDPNRTITGDTQMNWLKKGLAESVCRWKLVGNPVMITPVVFPPLPAGITGAIAGMTGAVPQQGVPYNLDQWDGYQADRRELLTHLHDRKIQNTVFLTGDIHSSWASDLPLDAGTYPVTPSVATELVGTSVTSDNLDELTGSPPRTTSVAVEAAFRASNRHIKMIEFDSHGYSILNVTPEQVRMDWYYISSRTDRNATARLASSWAVANGTQTVRQVS